MRVDQAAKLLVISHYLCKWPITQVDDLVELRKELGPLACSSRTNFVHIQCELLGTIDRPGSIDGWRPIECDERMVTKSSSTEILVINCSFYDVRGLD